MHTGGIRREDVPDVTGSGQQDGLMPPQRRNWKRCASHVYIAHFIEYQLHCERCAFSNRSAVSGWRSSYHCCKLQRLHPGLSVAFLLQLLQAAAPQASTLGSA